MKVRACLRSGLCCRKSPCPYGEVISATNSQCSSLVIHENETTSCAKYEFIRIQPGADFVPAFGAGCCMPMFNEYRGKILERDYKGIEQVIEIKDFY